MGGFLWMFLGLAGHWPGAYWPFATWFAAQLAMAGVAGWSGGVRSIPKGAAIGLAAGWASVAVLGPALWIAPEPGLRAFGAGVLGAVLAAALFPRIEPRLGSGPQDAARWLRQAACALLGSLVAAVLCGGG